MYPSNELNKEALSQGNLNITPPDGWAVEAETEKEVKSNNVMDAQAEVKRTLPMAASRVEQLMDEVYNRYNMRISAAHLTIDPASAYHIFLVVGIDDYHAPKMQAAKLLTEKYEENDDDLSIRFTFIANPEEGISFLSDNKYKLEHIHSIRDAGSN